MVPRHPLNDLEFISNSLARLGERHDRLLDLIEDVATEDPFASLRLLQVCGVNRFGHIISVVPPPLVLHFATTRDEEVSSTFASIQQASPPDLSTHTLLVGAGGASVTSLAKHATWEPSFVWLVLFINALLQWVVLLTAMWRRCSLTLLHLLPIPHGPLSSSMLTLLQWHFSSLLPQLNITPLTSSPPWMHHHFCWRSHFRYSRL